MDARAVEQAWERLKRAEEALHRIKLAEGYSPAEEAWTDFLMAAGTIYTKLEQGAKGHGKSAGWYGRKKKERKDDPLLRYLHYARNSEEHGIERVVVKETGVSFEGPLKFGEWRLTKVNYADATKKPQTVEKRDFRLGRA